MKWHGKSGLSLLELLVALILVAVIAASLATTTGLGVRLLDRTETLSEGRAELVLRSRLRHWIQSAVPPSQIASFSTAFEGRPDSFSFTSLTLTQFAPDAAALRVHVAAKEDVLEMQVDYLNDAGGILRSETRTLASGVSEALMSYYDNDPTAAGWTENWPHPERLPALIRLTAAPDSTPYWPEFTVRPVRALPY